MAERYDVIVIGAGIAGLTAGIYLKRSALKSLLLEKSAPGGRLLNIHAIDNYPSEPLIAGPDLAAKILGHATELGVAIDYGNVQSVVKQADHFLVVSDMASYETSAVIVATGTTTKTFGVPGEKEFNGRGVSYCATCDGHFFKGKDVMVVGYKDRAVEEAIYLSSLVRHLYFVLPQPLETTEVHEATLKSLDNVELLPGATLKSIAGDKLVTSAQVQRADGSQKDYAIAGIFPLAGEKSSSDFLAGLNPKNRNGFLNADSDLMTSVPGVFACGDILDKKLRQLVNAAGEGALAATSAISYVHSLSKGLPH
jgi:thioredoxin reductase (NADPH)